MGKVLILLRDNPREWVNSPSRGHALPRSYVYKLETEEAIPKPDTLY